MEVVDDVVVGNIGDGGSCVKKALDVGPDGFALLLLAHCKSMSSDYSMERPLEVFDEDLEILPRVYGLVHEALQPGEGCRFQGHREVDDLGVGVPSCNINSGRV